MPSENEKRLALTHLNTSVTQCFTLLVWINNVGPRLHLTQTPEENVRMMKNAATIASLLALRTVNEFFRKRDSRHRDDDVVAEDFDGFISHGPFLTSAESAALNKRVLHLTYSDQPNAEASWNVADWTIRGIPLCLPFYAHVATSMPNDEVARGLVQQIPAIGNLLRQTGELAEAELAARRQQARP